MVPPTYGAIALLLLLATFTGIYNLLSKFTNYGALSKLIFSLLATIVLGVFLRYVLLFLGILTLSIVGLAIYRLFTKRYKREKVKQLFSRITKVWK